MDWAGQQQPGSSQSRTQAALLQAVQEQHQDQQLYNDQLAGQEPLSGSGVVPGGGAAGQQDAAAMAAATAGHLVLPAGSGQPASPAAAAAVVAAAAGQGSELGSGAFVHMVQQGLRCPIVMGPTGNPVLFVREDFSISGPFDADALMQYIQSQTAEAALSPGSVRKP
jgi:hypothetical protein